MDMMDVMESGSFLRFIALGFHLHVISMTKIETSHERISFFYFFCGVAL